jgi:hypothetical protein
VDDKEGLVVRITNADLIGIIYRQREFSMKTFGPGKRTSGIVDHIRKELVEIEESKGDLSEWIDVIILALDGAWRTGATPSEIVEDLIDKQRRNETRTWPDWRRRKESEAIEHVRDVGASGGGGLGYRCPHCHRAVEMGTLVNYEIFCPHCNKSIGVTGAVGPS